MVFNFYLVVLFRVNVMISLKECNLQFIILNPGCTAEQFACADLTKCIAIGDTCNHATDCEDGSDELPLNIACGSNRFFILIYLRYLYFSRILRRWK